MVNICIAETGGKGQLLVSNIISQALINADIQVKSYHRIGLTERNGPIYSTVRIGSDVLSTDIPVGCGDIMMGLEPLEAYRRSYIMKKNKDGIIILLNYQINTSRMIYQVDTYPQDIQQKLEIDYTVLPVNFDEITKNVAINECTDNFRIRTNEEFIPRKLLDAYIYCVGILAALLNNLTNYTNWIDALEKNIPSCILEETKEFFTMGYQVNQLQQL